MNKLTKHAAIAALLITQVACLQWFSGKIGTGVARLSVRNIGTTLLAVYYDETCGFSSEDVLANPVVDGVVGGLGTVTWRVEGCELNFPEWTDISSDCNDVKTRAKGKVVVTAEQSIYGYVTGDPEKPVIPLDADSAEFRIESATFTNFGAEKTDNDSWMNIIEGSMSATIAPRLAASEGGSCSILSPNISFTDITYTPSLVHVYTPDRDFEVDVDASSFEAQNGVHGEHENRMSGTITVWGNNEEVPNDGDGLNPDFSLNIHDKSYECKDEIALPLSYSCDLTPKFGNAAAQMTVLNFAGLAKYLGSDTFCGFESPQVLNNYGVTGQIGYPGGEVTYTVEDCELSFPEPVEISTDCQGETMAIQGTVRVSGTKVVAGYITGDPELPVIPNSMTPATVTLQADVAGLVVTKSKATKSLVLQSGQLSGTLIPRTMLDKETGVCSIPTTHSEFSDIAFKNGTVRIRSGEKNFDLKVAEAQLYAVNGQFGATENHLEGAIDVNGATVNIPLEGTEPALDPEYDPVYFRSTFDCQDNADYVTTDDACRFEKVLATNVSRLLVKTYGVVTKTIDLDNDCGFDNKLDQIWEFVDTSLIGPAFSGEQVTVDWAVDQCVIGGPQPELIFEDCVGSQIYVNGTAEVTGTKAVTGEIVMSSTPLHPRTRTGAHFEFTEIALNGFSALELKADGEGYEPHIIFHNGSLTGMSHPVTGEAEDSSGAYFIKTPVSGFEAVSISDAQITLRSGAKTFHLALDASNLNAFNGSYGSQTNSLMGDIWLNGNHYVIAEDGEAVELNPAFEQGDFDATYACKENLLEPVPSR